MYLVRQPPFVIMAEGQGKQGGHRVILGVSWTSLQILRWPWAVTWTPDGVLVVDEAYGLTRVLR
jgi:hypothetical protein